MERINPRMGLGSKKEEQQSLHNDAVPSPSSTTVQSFYKSVALEVLSILAALATGYFYSLYLSGTGSLWMVLVALTLFLILAAFGTVLGGGLVRRSVVLMLETLALSVFFFSVPPVVLGGAALIFLILSFWGEIESKRDFDNSLTVRFTKSITPKVTKLFTGCILIAIVFFLPQWDVENAFVSRSYFSGLYENVSGIVQSVSSELVLTSTVEEFARSVIAPRVQRQVQKERGLQDVPPDVLDKEIDEMVRQAISRTGESLGITLNPSAPLQTAFYDYIAEKIRSFYDQFGISFIAIWGVALFFAIRSIGVFFIWIVLFLAYLLYEILSVGNIIAVQGEQRTKETLTLT